MAFKCLCYFVMFKKGPQLHISVCMTEIISLQGVALKSHTHTHTHSIYMQKSVQLGSFIYSQRGGYRRPGINRLEMSSDNRPSVKAACVTHTDGVD